MDRQGRAIQLNHVAGSVRALRSLFVTLRFLFSAAVPLACSIQFAMSKPTSQPASHRSGKSITGVAAAEVDGGASDPAHSDVDATRDGARSEASAGDLGGAADSEELLTKSLLKRG